MPPERATRDWVCQRITRTANGWARIRLDLAESSAERSRVLIDQIQAIPEGVDAEVWLPDDLEHGAFPLCHRLEQLGVRVRHLPLPIMRRAYQTPTGLLRLSGRSAGLVQRLHAHRPDVVYCTTSATFLAAPAARLAQVPHVIGHVHEIWSDMDRRILGPLARSCGQLLAISTAVRDRIRTTYGLCSTVVSAPVTAPAPVEGAVSPDASLTDAPFFLCISRLLSYKNVDKVIEAFRGSGRRLVVVGRGPEKDALQAICPDNVTMLQDLTDAEMAWLYQHCAAVVAASYEDYGLTPLEGGMYGKPCVVLRWGGFLDTVVEGINGEFFDEPEPEQIRDAVDRVVAMDWDTDVIRHHVHKFEESAFISEIRRVIDESTPGPKPAEPGATELRPTDLGPAASAKEMV